MKNTTKDLIANTFIGLVGTKPMQKVTVQDLVEACGVSRQTFYNHFDNKQEVVQYVYLRAFDDDYVGEFSDYVGWTQKAHRVFAAYDDFFKQAYKTTDFYIWLKQLIVDSMRAYIVRTHGAAELTPELSYALDSYVGGSFWSYYEARWPGRIEDHIDKDVTHMPEALRPYFLPGE